VFVVIIVLNSFVSNLNSAISGLVHATGKMKTYQLCGGSISLVSVVFVYIAMLICDIPSIALVVLFVLDCIRQVVALVVLKSIVNDFSLMKYLREVIMPLIAVVLVSSLFPTLPHMFMQDGFLRLCVVLIVSVVSIGVSIYMIGLNRNEKSIIIQMRANVKDTLLKR